MAAAAKYASDDTGEADRPLKVCAEAGRKCVRNIHQYPVLSQEWLQLVDSLKQLTRLVSLEKRMPPNARVGEAHGRNTDSEGTLWDQESHENAIRILVEEAKVNLCLRMMNDYKKWQYNTTERKATIADAMRSFDYSEAQLEQKCRQFEEALGHLLWRAFVHVETLQLMDIPLLIEHVALVLGHCDMHRQEKLECTEKEQELIVMCYFASLMKHAEKLNNSELLAKSREFQLLRLATSHILVHAETEYDSDFLFEILLGVAALCYNEDWSSDWPKFFEDADGKLDREQMVAFLGLKGFVDRAICDANGVQAPEKVKVLRPLLDFFKALTRKIG